MECEAKPPMHWMTRYRNYTIAFIIGSCVGAYGSYNWEHFNAEHILALALKGGCPGRDMDKSIYWYPCKDTYIAVQMAEHAQAVDAEVTAVLNDMEKHQPKAKVQKASAK